MSSSESDSKPDLTLADLRDRVSGVRIAMVVTIENGCTPSTRPLTVQRITDDGDIEFLVPRDAGWVEAGQSTDVCLVDEGRTWVSVSGHAEYLADDTAVDELWDAASAVFFADRSEAQVMRVHATAWSYWVAPNRLAQVVDVVRALVTDTTPDLGESGVVVPMSADALD